MSAREFAAVYLAGCEVCGDGVDCIGTDGLLHEDAEVSCTRCGSTSIVQTDGENVWIQVANTGAEIIASLRAERDAAQAEMERMAVAFANDIRAPEAITTRRARYTSTLITGGIDTGVVAWLESVQQAREADSTDLSEWWRKQTIVWQDWATQLLDELGRQPRHGQHGAAAMRDMLEQLAVAGPGVPRCSCCGCFASRHEVDDEELRECLDCECKQWES